jgi:hypothetical protein
MVDYSKGKIYKIVCNTTDEIYIGSTTQPLYKRLSKHKTDIKRNNITSKILLEKGKCDIILIEDYPCERKEQLHARERYWIENLPNTVNRCIPTRTQKEHYEDNKEIIKAKVKEYRDTHKEQIVKHRQEYYDKHKEEILGKVKKYYDEHKEEKMEYNRNYNRNHQQQISEQKKEYYEKNKDRISKQKKEYYEKSKKIICCPSCGAEILKQCLTRHQNRSLCKSI